MMLWTIWESAERDEFTVAPLDRLPSLPSALDATGRSVPADVAGRPMRLVKVFAAAGYDEAMRAYHDHYGLAHYRPME